MGTNKTCPKCGVVGDIAVVFGYRKVPHPIPQSWCRGCRNGKPVSETLVIRTHNDKFQIHKSQRDSIHVSTGVKLDEMTREELTSLYCRWYPNDKANTKRSAKFMTDRLTKKMEATAI